MGLVVGFAFTLLIGLNIWASASLAKRNDLEASSRALLAVLIWVLPVAGALWVLIANARAGASRPPGTPGTPGH